MIGQNVSNGHHIEKKLLVYTERSSRTKYDISALSSLKESRTSFRAFYLINISMSRIRLDAFWKTFSKMDMLIS